MKNLLFTGIMTVFMGVLVYAEFSQPYKKYVLQNVFDRTEIAEETPRKVESLNTLFWRDGYEKALVICFLSLQIFAPFAFCWKDTRLTSPGWIFLGLSFVEGMLLVGMWGRMRLSVVGKEVEFLPGYYLTLLGGGIACVMLAYTGWKLLVRNSWSG